MYYVFVEVMEINMYGTPGERGVSPSIFNNYTIYLITKCLFELYRFKKRIDMHCVTM